MDVAVVPILTEPTNQEGSMRKNALKQIEDGILCQDIGDLVFLKYYYRTASIKGLVAHSFAVYDLINGKLVSKKSKVQKLMSEPISQAFICFVGLN